VTVRERIECSDSQVEELLGFVLARQAEDEATARAKQDAILADVCALAHNLLDIAEDRCDGATPCQLSARHIRALAAVAALHPDHPEFRKEWLAWNRPRV
jgi:hypothetical protein